MRTGAGLLLGLVLAQTAQAQDSYQWLEAPSDAHALNWAHQQTEVAQAKIRSLPEHASIKAELRRALDAGEPPPHIALLGPTALKFQRSTAHPHGVLSVARRGTDGVPGVWRDVLDIDAYGKEHGRAYELAEMAEGSICLPPDFTRCLLSLSPMGGDEVEVREFDLGTGTFVANGFSTPASHASVTWLDRDRLLVQHTIGDAPKLSSGWPAATYLWKRGMPLASAKEIYRGHPSDAMMGVGASQTGAKRVGIIARAIDYSTFEYRIVRSDGSVELVPLPKKIRMSSATLMPARIVVQLAEAATIGDRHYPAETILAYETAADVPAGKRLSLVYAPVPDEHVVDPFMGYAQGPSTIRVVMNRRGVKQLVTFSRSGGAWRASRARSEPVGVTASFDNADPASEAAIIRRSGYLVPTRLDLTGASPTTLFAEKPAFGAGRFRVELKTARSKDGTEIDYFLLRPITIAKAGATPTLMTGYGAFGSVVSPGYLDDRVGGRSLVPWLNRGGALAVPLIRGGGDRGEAWHQAAIREKRQNSYDDFAAVAEALIRDNFTAPRHLGVFGQSNGGLLAAVMGTQRPDLYGAVVSDVPLTDLVRMPFMGMGAAWTDEYGRVDRPAELKAMTAYSPFQQVRSGVRYPPFLITVATSDDRVGPGHARKLAAKLKDVGAPVYFLEDQAGGHGVSDALNNPDLMADRMAFLTQALEGR